MARLYSFRVVVWDFQTLGVRASLITLDSGSIAVVLFPDAYLAVRNSMSTEMTPMSACCMPYFVSVVIQRK